MSKFIKRFWSCPWTLLETPPITPVITYEIRADNSSPSYKHPLFPLKLSIYGFYAFAVAGAILPS